MSKAWPLVPLSNVLRHRKEFVTIDDLSNYRRPRVQLHAKGIVLRDEVPGALIKTKKQQVCQAGEFLVAEIDAKVGGFGIVPDALDGAIVSSHYFLFGVDETRLDRRYLDYFIRTPAFREQVEAQGSTNYAAIRPAHVLGYMLPLPPLAEQRRVVARIEELAGQIQDARHIREQALMQSSALMLTTAAHEYDEAARTSRMQRLQDLCIQITDGTHYTPRYVESGVPFLSVKDISGGRICFDDVRYVTAEEHATLTKRCKPTQGDILLTKIGTTGLAKVIDVEREFSIFVSLALLKPKPDVLDPYFAEYMLNSTRLREHSAEGTRGVGNQNLVLKFIRAFPLPVPVLQEQGRIVDRLDAMKEQVESLKRAQAETSAELDALLPAILDRAYKGKLP